MRAAITYQSASMNHHKSFSIHADKISAKKYRTETDRNYTAGQTTRLCCETVENAEKTFNAEHLVSLVQKKKLTCSAERIVIRRLRMSHHSSQKLTVSETTSNLITDRNARHRFF